MKKIVLIIASLAIALTSYAQKVVLHGSSGTQHFDGTSALQSAYTAAVSGDTIYLPGGLFNSPANFEKQLTIFGAGHYVDSTLATGKTFINGNIQLRENADNFHIEGVEISGDFTFYNNESVNGVLVKHCKINGTFNVAGNLSNASEVMALTGSVVVGSINLSNAKYALISNSIINYVYNSEGNYIHNNICFGRWYSSNSNNGNLQGNGNQVYNNIFLTPSLYATAGTGNTLYNNLFTHTPGFGTGNALQNNYTDISDVFVNQSGTAFNYTHDYHLQDPTTYLGSDGTQVGIYGGAFPYKEGAVPSNPHIQEQTIAPTATNGQLNVHIKAAAQNN